MNEDVNFRRVAAKFLLEISIYGTLLTVYFLLVLRFLGDPLEQLFEGNLVLYGFAALGLIAAQAVVLEIITSFLMRILFKEEIE